MTAPDFESERQIEAAFAPRRSEPMRRRPACKRRSGNGCSLGRRRLPVAIHRRSPLRHAAKALVAQNHPESPLSSSGGGDTRRSGSISDSCCSGAGTPCSPYRPWKKWRKTFARCRRSGAGAGAWTYRFPAPNRPNPDNRLTRIGCRSPGTGWLPASRRTESDRFPKWKGPGEAVH